MRRQTNHIAARILAFIAVNMLIFGCASQPSVRDTDSHEIKDQIASLQSISANETEDSIDLVISADGPLTYSALKQPDPPAVVLYFPQTSVDALPAMQVVGKGPLLAVAVSNGLNNRTARMEIGLLEDTPYSARQEGSKIFLSFAKNRPALSDAAAPLSIAPAADGPSHNDSIDPRPVAVSAANAPGVPSKTSSAARPSAWVNKIDFMSEADGKSTLVVVTSGIVDYQIKKAGPRHLEVVLFNTGIPAHHQRPLITTRFNSAVDRIMPLQPSKTKQESILSIDLREAVAYSAEQTDNLLMIHFAASSIPPKPMEQAVLPAWKQIMSAEESEVKGMLAQHAEMERLEAPSTLEHGSGAPYGTASKEDVELKALLQPRQKKYSGEKIALDFYETDIKNVFRILREVSGKNFAIDKDVNGKVTMTLDKPVPWDQVLDLVLRMNQLGMAHEGEIIRIATLETLKKEEDLRKAQLEALKKAREEIKALEPLITKYIPVSYSSAGNEVKPHIEMILTQGRGSVSVDGKNNQIIITDTAAVVKQAEEIIRRIDKVTAQVVIEAKVVEVSNTFSKELGITWNMSHGPGVIPGLAWNTSTNMAMNFPSASNSSIGINFSRLSGVPFVLQARLNALETAGEGRILSSPKILTLDNKKAKIKQGVEYPYLERDSSGGSSVKFKNIDLLLEVTPHVTPDNRISLTIFITKNDVAGVTAGVPSVATNEAQTELLVNDADTVVIGGIIKSTENAGQTGFPGLNRIPLVGWLFKNSTDTTQSNELLIFITPRILQLEQAVAQNN